MRCVCGCPDDHHNAPANGDTACRSCPCPELRPDPPVVREPQDELKLAVLASLKGDGIVQLFPDVWEMAVGEMQNVPGTTDLDNPDWYALHYIHALWRRKKAQVEF